MPSSPPPCRCPSSSPTSIAHALFHCTTRTPLYVHPALWTDVHLSLLRVVATSPPNPAPPDRASRHRRPLCQSYLEDYHDTLHCHDCPCGAIIYLISTIATASARPDLKKPYFAYIYDDLDLHIGPISSIVSPHAFLVRANPRHSVPFLAFSSPTHRLHQRTLHTRRGRTRAPPTTSTGIYHSDLAVLIALAQEQHRVLPRKSTYRVCVLSPNEPGTHVHVMEASVAGTYLASLVDLETPLTDTLQVACSLVEIGSDGEELLDLVNRLLDEAPNLPPGKKAQGEMRKDKRQKGKKVVEVGGQ